MLQNINGKKIKKCELATQHSEYVMMIWQHK